MPPTEPLDLSPLNRAEREVLALLARGHTAKSIASLTGKTEGAINERLREARRKTGISSSRELARRFAESLKTSDEQIGVAPPGSAEPGSERGPTQRLPGPTGKGIIAMAILSSAVLSALVLVNQQTTPPAAPANDPLLSNSFAAKPWPSPAERHAQLRGETRDVKWATEKEAAIRAAFTDHAGLKQPGDKIRVICGKTLCEVAVTMQTYDEKRTPPAVKAIQDVPLRDAMESLGLVGDIMSFGNRGDEPSEPLFVSYWRRK